MPDEVICTLELSSYTPEEGADTPEERTYTLEKWIAALEKSSVAPEEMIRPQISQIDADFFETFLLSSFPD